MVTPRQPRKNKNQERMRIYWEPYRPELWKTTQKRKNLFSLTSKILEQAFNGHFRGVKQLQLTIARLV